jgi:2-methylcitrate dehydratase PrpD
MIELAKKHDLKPEDIDSIAVGTNSNVPNALIYPLPKTALEAKFSIPFCMAVGILERKAGIAQFKDRKVRDPKVVELMKRVTLHVDQELEALGYDQVRSRIRIRLKDGKTIEERADVARGHPLKPMSWAEIREKFRDCARRVLTLSNTESAIAAVSNLERMKSIAPLVEALSGGGLHGRRGSKKIAARRPRSKRWNGIPRR